MRNKSFDIDIGCVLDRKVIVRLINILVSFFLIIMYVFAIDMLEDSEQFYVVQGIFENLAIESQDCDVVDDYVNFACGKTDLDDIKFSESVDKHINEFLSGLSKDSSWFYDGYSYIAEYSSSYGHYYFAITTNGFVIIAFTPLE